MNRANPNHNLANNRKSISQNLTIMFLKSFAYFFLIAKLIIRKQISEFIDEKIFGKPYPMATVPNAKL